MSSSPTSARQKRWLGAGSWVAAAAAASAFAPLRTMQARGVVLLLVHAADALAVAALLVLCTAVGEATLRRMGLSFSTTRDRLPFATALGSGIVATELLGACALFGVHSWILALTLGATAVGVGSELVRVVSPPTDLSSLEPRSWHTEGFWATAIPLGVVAVVLIALALVPPSDWDSLMYHILVPNRWLRDGRISTLAGNGHVAFVGLVHMLYLPLLAIRSLSGPAVLSAALALMLGLEVLALATRWFGPTVGRGSAVLLWGTPTILLVASTAKIDATLALFLILGHDALLTAWRQRSARHLDLAAVILGLSLGVKYQAGAYALALIPLVLAAIAAIRPNLRHAIPLIVRFAVIATCATIPWLLKNQILYGVASYPFFAGHSTQPWLTSLLPTNAALTLDPRVFQIQSMARTRFNVHDAFLNPIALGAGGEMAFYFLNPLLVLVPSCLLFARKPGVLGLVGPSLIYVATILLIAPTANLRYLMPAIAPLTIVCTVALCALSERLPVVPRWAGRAMVGLVCLIPSVGAMYVWLAGTNAVANLLGTMSGQQLLTAHASPTVRSQTRIAVAANKLVPPADTILMIFEARGLYLDAPSIEDTELTNWPTLEAALGPSHCLGGSGIRYVLARQAAARYQLQRGVPDDLLGLKSFERFANRCLIPVYTDSDATLYSIRPVP